MMILLHLVCLRRVVLEEEEKLPKLRTPSLRELCLRFGENLKKLRKNRDKNEKLIINFY